MSYLPARTAATLDRALRPFIGAGTFVKVEEQGVLLPISTVRAVISALSFVEGGSRVPFVSAMLSHPSSEGVRLRGDEGMHLARALEDIERARERQRRVDTGRLPHVLSPREVKDLERRSPMTLALYQRGLKR